MTGLPCSPCGDGSAPVSAGAVHITTATRSIIAGDARMYQMDEILGRAYKQGADFEKARAATAVGQIIEELTQPRDRAVMRLYYLEEKDKTQVCDYLEIDDRTFNSVVHRARERFKKLALDHPQFADQDRDVNSDANNDGNRAENVAGMADKADAGRDE